MDTNERMSHFRKSAKLLVDEMDARDWLWLGVDEEEALLDLLSKRLYDFKRHVLHHVDDHELEESFIPDMTELPPMD